MITQIISILDWVKDKLPIQGRVERWRNELEQLNEEQKQLRKGKWTAQKADRYTACTKRMHYLGRLLKNR